MPPRCSWHSTHRPLRCTEHKMSCQARMSWAESRAGCRRESRGHIWPLGSSRCQQKAPGKESTWCARGAAGDKPASGTRCRPALGRQQHQFALLPHTHSHNDRHQQYRACLALHAAGKILIVADTIVHRAVPFAPVVVNKARADIRAVSWLHGTLCARALC